MLWSEPIYEKQTWESDFEFAAFAIYREHKTCVGTPFAAIAWTLAIERHWPQRARAWDSRHQDQERSRRKALAEVRAKAELIAAENQLRKLEVAAARYARMGEAEIISLTLREAVMLDDSAARQNLGPAPVLERPPGPDLSKYTIDELKEIKRLTTPG